MQSFLAGLFMIVFLVVIHEFGHFLAAKWFGVGVPVFSVGVGPRVWGATWRGTEYRLSALPFGGYVRMSGADPFGEEDPDDVVSPEEDFMSRPAWQRLVIMAAGPVVNLALPFFLFTAVLMAGEPQVENVVGTVLPGSVAEQVGFADGDRVVSVDGEPTGAWIDVADAIDAASVAGTDVHLVIERDGATLERVIPASDILRTRFGVDLDELGLRSFHFGTRVGVEDPSSAAGRAGLQTGDIITAVDGVEVLTWEDLLAHLDGDRHALTVLRAAESERVRVADQRGVGEALTLTLEGPAEVVLDEAWENAWGVLPIMLFAADVHEDSPAARAGVVPGDRFLSVDGQPVRSFDHFIAQVMRSSEGDSLEARPIRLDLIRDGQHITKEMIPEVQVVVGEVYARPIIGVTSYVGSKVYGDTVRWYYPPGEALRRASQETWYVIQATGTALGNLFTGWSAPKDNLGGPVAIFQQAGASAEAGIFTYARMIGAISVSLGLFNLLPVPVLDGGNILFYLIEWLSGRPVSIRIRERLQMAGVLGLVVLMLLVTVNDIHRWLEF